MDGILTQYDNFATLFSSWVNRILNIKISNNLAVELLDGNILVLLFNTLCPFLCLVGDPEQKRTKESNYQILEMAQRKLSIREEYFIKPYYLDTGNVGPIVTSICLIIGRIMDIMDNRVLQMSVGLKSLVKNILTAINQQESTKVISDFLSAFHQTHETALPSSRITNYTHDTICHFEEETTFTSEAVTLYDCNDDYSSEDHTDSPLLSTTGDNTTIKNELLTLLLYRIFGQPTEATTESETEMTDEDSEDALEELDDDIPRLSDLTSADSTAELLTVFDRLLSSHGMMEKSVREGKLLQADKCSYEPNMSYKTEQGSIPVNEEEVNEVPFEVDKTEVNPEDSTNTVDTEYLSLFRSLGYVPQETEESVLVDEVHTEESDTSSKEMTRQKVDDMKSLLQYMIDYSNGGKSFPTK